MASGITPMTTTRWSGGLISMQLACGAKVNYDGPDDGKIGLDTQEFPEAPYAFMTWVNTDGHYWLKAGCDDPENFLGNYSNFNFFSRNRQRF